MAKVPKPLKLHKAEGTYRKDRHKSLPLNPGAKVPPPPSDLSAKAKAKWRKIAPLLAKAGILSETDLDALAAYCEAWAVWRQATDTIAKDGATYQNEGLVKRHPAIAIMQQANNNLMAWADRLGLTPAGRLRLKIEPSQPQEDPFDSFLKKGKHA